MEQEQEPMHGWESSRQVSWDYKHTARDNATRPSFPDPLIGPVLRLDRGIRGRAWSGNPDNKRLDCPVKRLCRNCCRKSKWKKVIYMLEFCKCKKEAIMRMCGCRLFEYKRTGETGWKRYKGCCSFPAAGITWAWETLQQKSIYLLIRRRIAIIVLKGILLFTRLGRPAKDNGSIG